MASRKPPLAEFLATVKDSRKVNTHGHPNLKKIWDPDCNADAYQKLIITLVVSDPEDIRDWDDFAAGPQGLAVVGFRVLPGADFKRQGSDPNQVLMVGPPPDDELARLREAHAGLIEGMKHVGSDTALA